MSIGQSVQTKATLFALLTVGFWATAATAFKLSLAHIAYMPLVFYASLVSAVVLVFLCLITGQIKALKTWQAVDYARSVF